MTLLQIPKEVSISISGNHYFGCDYIFSNIYGSAVFTDDSQSQLTDANFAEISKNPERGDFSKETLKEFMSGDTGTTLDLSTMPDCNKEIEYSTFGTLQSDGNGGYFIRYSGDFSPICIHARKGRFSLNGQEDDFSELVFEKGKRNYIALPESLFFDESQLQLENENQSPIVLCLSTECIENNMTDNGGSLHVSYSIEVNGITAEVTDFVLTATDPLDNSYYPKQRKEKQ